MKQSLHTCFLFAAMGFTAVEAEAPAYFEQLRSSRVESSEIVKWTQVGPGMAGYCESFWCHPTESTVMFISPDMYNSYGSWDRGRSWQTIKDCDGDGSDMRRVQDIDFSHQNPKFGYAISITGSLFKTTDMGHTWSLTDFESRGRCSELAVDPTDQKIWYIGSGDFWNVKKHHRTKASMDNPTEGHVAPYVRYGSILRSLDGGRTWSELTEGFPETRVVRIGKNKVKMGLEVGRIIVDPTNNKNLIAITNYGVFRSTNQGNDWQSSGFGLPNNLPRDLDYFYDEKNGEFVLYLLEQSNFSVLANEVTCTGGVYKSTDHGATWSSISGDLAIDMSQVTGAAYINMYNNAVSSWLGSSKNDFRKKNLSRCSEAYSVFNRLRVNPKNKNEIYISDNTKHDRGFAPGDIWKTENGGKTWQPASRFGRYWKESKDSTYWNSRNNSTSVNVKFAHLQPEMDRSDETAGNRFLEVNAQGHVFACLDQQTISSFDGGKSWQQMDDFETADGSGFWIGRGASNLPGRGIVFDTGVENRVLFCSGEHGLWLSEPRAEVNDKSAVAMKQIEGQIHESGAASIAAAAVHPNDPNTIYTLQFRQRHRGAFRRTKDGGKTWKNLSEPVAFGEDASPSDKIFQTSLLIDPREPNNIYFVVMENSLIDVSTHHCAAIHGGVYKSTDGGYSWRISNSGLPDGAAVHHVIMDKNRPSVLFAALNENKAGTVAGGLYISKNGAKSWSEVEIPEAIRSVNNVFQDRTKGTLFIACGGKHDSFEQGGVWKSDDGVIWEKIFYMPYIWQVETSPLDPNILTVAAAAQDRRREGLCQYNPGAYLSLDGGKTWNKINKNLGQPDRIVELRPDPSDPNKIWLALWGSGWAVGNIKQ